jgi:hypothetical protein
LQKLFLSLVFASVTAAPVNAAVLTWYANLNSAQENNPANTTTGTGYGVVQFDDVTNVLRVYESWQGLTGASSASHIHCCVAPTGSTGIALDLWLTSQPASGVIDLSWDLDTVNPFRAAFTTANGGTALSAFNALRAAMDTPQFAYFNIHTAAFPGGEIRGNISPIPEPASLTLMMAGAAALLIRRRLARG